MSPAAAPMIEGWLRAMAAVAVRVGDELDAANGSSMRHALDFAASVLGSVVDTP
jgi:hypothetical protein